MLRTSELILAKMNISTKNSDILMIEKKKQQPYKEANQWMLKQTSLPKTSKLIIPKKSMLTSKLMIAKNIH